MSYIGSRRRLWRLTSRGRDTMVAWHPALRTAAVAGLYLLALAAILAAWVVVTVWYVLFSVLLVPYRLVRRGSRKRKLEELRHRELLGP
jgi:fatty acid desaturase